MEKIKKKTLKKKDSRYKNDDKTQNPTILSLSFYKTLTLY